MWPSLPPQCAAPLSPRRPAPRSPWMAGTKGSSRNVASFDTLRWRNGRLEMLDQRMLPARTVYLPFESADAVADGIREMVVRGAPAIGCAAAYGIALEALRLKDLPAA